MSEISFSGKKIALIAPLVGNHHYGNQVAQALLELGIRVDGYDYRVNPGLQPPFPDDLDAILVMRGESISVDVIKSWNKPKFLWYGEYIWGEDEAAKANRAEVEKARFYDKIIWCGGREPRAIEYLKSIGVQGDIPAVYPIRMMPKMFYPADTIDRKYKYDVGFIGTQTGRRVTILKSLEDAGFKVGCRTTYDLEEQNRIINQCKMMLHINFTDYFTHSTINLRTFDILSTKTLLLHEYVEQPMFFTDMEHMVFWKGMDDLKDKIKFYLEEVDAADDIATNGYVKSLDYSTKDIVERLMKVVLG